MPIMLKSEAEMDAMREAGRIVGQTLAGIREMIRPGLNLLEVEDFVSERFKRLGAIETFRGYGPGGKPPYPSNVCASVNEELVHGIPRDRVLEEGDIVTFDLGATYKGFVGDSAITVGVGRLSAEAQRLMEVTEGALWAGIEAMGTGSHLNDVSAAIEDAVPGGVLDRARIHRPRRRPPDARGAAGAQLPSALSGAAAQARARPRPRTDGQRRRARDPRTGRRLDRGHAGR